MKNDRSNFLASVTRVVLATVIIGSMVIALPGTSDAGRDPGINQPGPAGNVGADPGINQPGPAGNVGRDPGINQPGPAGNRGGIGR